MSWQPYLQLMLSGGPVLMVVALCLTLLWFLIIHKLLTIKTVATARCAETINAAKPKTVWQQKVLQRCHHARIKQQLSSEIPLISALIALAPLLGLLGTVTGMIMLFEQLQLSGHTSALLLGDGIARATLPTVAGLTTALSGFVGRKWIIIKVRKQLANWHQQESAHAI